MSISAEQLRANLRAQNTSPESDQTNLSGSTESKDVPLAGDQDRRPTHGSLGQNASTARTSEGASNIGVQGSESSASPAQNLSSQPQNAPPRRQTRARAAPSHDTMPHSIEAEQGVLGSIIHGGGPTLAECEQRITPDHFFDAINRRLYETLLEDSKAGKPVDLISLTTRLFEAGKIDSFGGASAITDLATFVTTSAAIDYYLGILHDKYLLRQIILGATEAVRRAYEPEADSDELVGELIKKAAHLHTLSRPKMDGVESFDFDSLLAFNPLQDSTQLLGQRWQCRGFTALWAGPAGAGKSTLEMQLAIYWACGVPCFGIKPVAPLKSLIVQAENDLGDTGEQFQGVMQGIEKCALSEIDFSKNGASHVRKNVIVKRLVGATGNKFLSTLDSLIESEKPELVWIDPLFAFAGCDLIDAEKVGNFLRHGLIPIAIKRSVSVNVIHHIAKPSRDNTDKSSWSDLDFQYLGFGSAEIQNSFRAVNIILPVSGHDNVFRLILSKRGGRAGALSTDSEHATNIYLTQAKEGICWLQTDKPEDRPQGRAGAGQFQSKFEQAEILEYMSMLHGISTGALQTKLSTETGMSKSTFHRLFRGLKKSEKVGLDSDKLWVILQTK
jgi:hypothetical protein